MSPCNLHPSGKECVYFVEHVPQPAGAAAPEAAEVKGDCPEHATKISVKT